MHGDEVPLEAEAGAGEVAAAVAVLEFIAVGDGALVFHPEVRRLDQLEAVLVPGIRAEPVLEAGEHRPHLLPLHPRGIGVNRERPEVEREAAGLAGEALAPVRVRSRVDRDAIGIDRRGDEPLPRGGPIAVGLGAAEPAVRDVHHRVGHRDGDALRVRLIGVVDLERPPDRGPEPLIRRGDEGLPERVLLPDQAAIPGRILRRAWRAVVVDGELLRRAGPLRRHQRHEEGVSRPSMTQRPAVLANAVHLERRLQVELHLAGWAQDAIADRVLAADGAVDRLNADLQVVEGGVPPASTRAVAATERIGMGEARRGLRRGAAGDNQEQPERTKRHREVRSRTGGLGPGGQ